jgi:hypothetical protein
MWLEEVGTVSLTGTHQSWGYVLKPYGTLPADLSGFDRLRTSDQATAYPSVSRLPQLIKSVPEVGGLLGQ